MGVDALIGQGVVRKVNDHGYTGELDWLTSRVDSEYFLRIRNAVIAAADELKSLDEPLDIAVDAAAAAAGSETR